MTFYSLSWYFADLSLFIQIRRGKGEKRGNNQVKLIDEWIKYIRDVLGLSHLKVNYHSSHPDEHILNQVWFR